MKNPALRPGSPVRQCEESGSGRHRLLEVLVDLVEEAGGREPLLLIADEQGLIQFANPAAGRLFQFANPIRHTIAEVVRNHQLVEAWRRCQQTRQMQSRPLEPQ